MTAGDHPVIGLLDHLGLDRVHVAGRLADDVRAVIGDDPHRIASLTVVAPNLVPVDEVRQLAERTTVLASDLALFGDLAAAALDALPAVTSVPLTGVETVLWTDLAADHGELISAAIDRRAAADPIEPPPSAPEPSGTIGEVTWRAAGTGPPLLLLPLGLAPSAWEPMIPTLAERFTVIVAGGATLGSIPMLESRGRSDGYRSMLDRLLGWIDVQPGEAMAEIGCGTGVVVRWLEHRSGGENGIAGADLNRYLLGEARDLARADGLTPVDPDPSVQPPVGRIRFDEGDAERLPYPDDTFDVVISTTVMEEVDASAMMAELVRITRPGGRIGVIVRATDLAMTVQAPLPEEDLAGFATVRRRPEGVGCASATLYPRFRDAGLVDLRFGPYLAVFDDADGPLERYVLGAYTGQLDDGSAARWADAIGAAERDGTFFLAWPHHLAVGTVPGADRSDRDR
ncbi:MAG: methyltransferase domain-containing protein [Actinomycetota bacterium]